jgi:hypothetical protein
MVGNEKFAADRERLNTPAPTTSGERLSALGLPVLETGRHGGVNRSSPHMTRINGALIAECSMLLQITSMATLIGVSGSTPGS